MDIYCGRCGEPWDNDSLHERVDELLADGELIDGRPPTYGRVSEDFIRRGCVALGGPPCQRTGSRRAAISQALMEEFGHDLDGVMAELDDFDYLGLLDEEAGL